MTRARSKVRTSASTVAGPAIRTAMRPREREAWQRDNAKAIDAYNDWVAKHGAFSDAWRKF